MSLDPIIDCLTWQVRDLEIQEDNIVGVLPHLGECLVAIEGHVDMMPDLGQYLGEQIADTPFVVDDQDACW